MSRPHPQAELDQQLRALVESVSAAAPPSPEPDDLEPARIGRASTAAVVHLQIGRDPKPVSNDPTVRPVLAFAAVALLVAAALGAAVWFLVDDPTEGRVGDSAATVADRPLPQVLVAAERYQLEPSATSLATLLEQLGGAEGVRVGVAEGAFDIVTFDPRDNDRALATRRGRSVTANQFVSEVWTIRDGDVDQALWNQLDEHDFVHFNRDGTATMWVHDPDAFGVSPRLAVSVGFDGIQRVATSEPVYPARFASDGGSVFALNTEPFPVGGRYAGVVADDGVSQTVLDAVSDFAWIDVPTEGIVVAYPAKPDDTTSVWDTATLAALPDHPLAGRSVRRLAVSDDGEVALGIGFDDTLATIDLTTGTGGEPFGNVNSVGIQQPVTLNNDGTIAVTVDRSGTVSMWFVADGERITAFAPGPTVVSRWLPEWHAARLSSAVAYDGSRVALRRDATATEPVSWLIIDTDPAVWLDRACARAGRGLTPDERTTLGLPSGPGACD